MPGRGEAPFLELPVSVEVVLLALRSDKLSVLLAPVGNRPDLLHWGLPAGPPQPGKDLDTTALEILGNTAGHREDPPHLEQLGAYADRRRDIRGRIIRIAYLAVIPPSGELPAELHWQNLRDLGIQRLDFDKHILQDAEERVRVGIENTPLATAFCPSEFTVAELRQVYQVVWRCSVDPRNFHRKVTSAQGFLKPTGRKTTRNGGRPAELYRRGNATVLWPAVTQAPW